MEISYNRTCGLPLQDELENSGKIREFREGSMNPELKDPKHPFLGPKCFHFFGGGGPIGPKKFQHFECF